MDINLMREFIVLAETLNFTNAATKLFIAQPTLSKHLSIMEKELQFPLFDRNRHGVSLTPEGKLYLSACREIIKKEESTMAEIMMLRQGFSGTVRLGVLYYALSDFVTPILVSAGKKDHQVNISLLSYQPTPLYNDILSGVTEVGIMYRIPGMPKNDQLVYTDIRWEHFCLLVTRDSLFFGRKSVSLSELSGQKILIQRNSIFLGDYIKKKLAEKGAKNIIYEDTDHVDTMATDVLIHNAAAITTRQTAQNVCSGKLMLKAIPVTDPDMRIMMTCMYRKDNDNRAIPMLLKTIREVFPDPQAEE